MEARIKYTLFSETVFEISGSEEFVRIEHEIFLEKALPELMRLFGNITLDGDDTEPFSAEEIERGDDTPEDIKSLDDCKRCLCNTCTIIEVCDIVEKRAINIHPERPNPCKGCYNGMRRIDMSDPAAACFKYVSGSENYA